MIATLEQEIVIPDGWLDLTQWLTPGVYYGHLELKRIYYQVADLGLNARPGDEYYRIGQRFFDAIRDWWQAGLLEMTSTVDRDGTPCDFWTAVFMAHHPDNKDFRVVDGWLLIGQQTL